MRSPKKVASGPLHISFDIDSLSPEVAPPATGVPVQQGLNLEDVVSAWAAPFQSIRSCARVDVVEINPTLGSSPRGASNLFRSTEIFNVHILPGEL